MPITGTLDCWPRAAKGHATVAALKARRNCRRFMSVLNVDSYQLSAAF
jgi:hypothetical protein